MKTSQSIMNLDKLYHQALVLSKSPTFCNLKLLPRRPSGNRRFLLDVCVVALGIRCVNFPFEMLLRLIIEHYQCRLPDRYFLTCGRPFGVERLADRAQKGLGVSFGCCTGVMLTKNPLCSFRPLPPLRASSSFTQLMKGNSFSLTETYCSRISARRYENHLSSSYYQTEKPNR